MRALILGSGIVGRAIAYYLNSVGFQISTVDIDRENLDKLKLLIRDAITIQADVLKDLNELLNGIDIVCNALPGNISFNVVKEVLMRGISVVDSSYMPQDPFNLDNVARDHGAIYVPDAGVAPGISNLIVGYFTRDLDEIEFVEIYVGGLPQSPQGLFLHKVNWSLTDFFDEYVREVRIVKDGNIRVVEPMSGYEIVSIDGEEYEAFYTDGLRTLLKTIKARNMYEKTLRYVGHLEKMKFLKKIGLLSREKIKVGRLEISRLNILGRLLREELYDPDMRDKILMAVRVVGKKSGKAILRKAILRDFYDEKLGISAMGRTTGYTNAIIAELIAGKKIAERGTVTMEQIGRELYNVVIMKLKKMGIEISVTEKES